MLERVRKLYMANGLWNFSNQNIRNFRGHVYKPKNNPHRVVILYVTHTKALDSPTLF